MDDLFQTRFFKAADLQNREVPATIADVEQKSQSEKQDDPLEDFGKRIDAAKASAMVALLDIGKEKETAMRHQILQADALEWLRAQPANTVDFVFGSPPYAEKGERYNGASRKWPTVEWVQWMLAVTREAVRVSTGYVVWIANGAVRDHVYLPACEGLIWLAYQSGIVCERPCVWHKNAAPNRLDWFGNDWEYGLAFKPASRSCHFDWEAVAEPPKYKVGGRFRQRNARGERRLGSEYPQNKLARPRDVIRVTVGGGHLGHPLAHEGEAPFPLALAKHFILTCCPPGGIVLDPFVGSGTTAHAAEELGRRCIGLDIRESQIALTQRRLADITGRTGDKGESVVT